MYLPSHFQGSFPPCLDVLALFKLELETTLKDSEKKPGCAPEKEEGQEGGEAELGGVLAEGNQSSQEERCS